MPLTNRNNVKYIYDLPYTERMELCKILDMNDKWETLAGNYMNFDMMTIQLLRREVRCGRSPTDELLTRWGHQNHTILELFVHLSKMQHYQAMSAIKDFVETDYHRLIYEGEANLSRFFKVPSAPPQSTASKSVASANFNNSKSSNVLPEKMQGLHVSQGVDSESKILNVDPPSVATRASSNVNEAPTALANNNINFENKNLATMKGEASKAKDNSAMSVAMEPVGPPMIPFKELEIVTNGWDHAAILGKGGFGTVYKGSWKNTPVAVKRTRATDSDENQTVQIQQILGELRMLNAYRHDNILPLYGYSVGGDDPCLIYQFMPCGSLEDRLLCRQGTAPLSWSQRLNIAIGTARGLQFLHTINDKPLIHGDIKSANILLDCNYQPKIGDFGLAREGPNSHYTHMKVSRVHGTRPYLPDEFLRAKKFSTKVDTHSFGIVVFELATGLRAYDDQRTHKFLRDLVENSTDQQIIYYIDRKAAPEEPQTYLSLIELGKVCVSRKPKDRPEMVHVLKDLEALSTQREVKVKSSQNHISPYELQMMHDQRSQFRNNNGSPLPDSLGTRVASPILDNRMSPRLMSQMPDNFMPPRVSPLPEFGNRNNIPDSIPRISSPAPYSLPKAPPPSIPRTMSPQPLQFAISRTVSPQHPVLPRTMSPQPPQFQPPAVVPKMQFLDSNPFKEANGSPAAHSNGVLPPQLRILAQQVPTTIGNNVQPQVQQYLPVVTPGPSISVSPPTNTQSSNIPSEDMSSESSYTISGSVSPVPTANPESIEPPTEDSQYSYVLPLISELGVKKEEAAQLPTHLPNTCISQSFQTSALLPNTLDSLLTNGEVAASASALPTVLPEVMTTPSTAKGKTLWILGESG